MSRAMMDGDAPSLQQSFDWQFEKEMAQQGQIVSEVAFTYLNSYDVMRLEFQQNFSLIFHPVEQTMDTQRRLRSNKFDTFWTEQFGHS